MHTLALDTGLLQFLARYLFLRILRENFSRKNMIAIIKLIWRVVGGVS